MLSPNCSSISDDTKTINKEESWNLSFESENINENSSNSNFFSREKENHQTNSLNTDNKKESTVDTKIKSPIKKGRKAKNTINTNNHTTNNSKRHTKESSDNIKNRIGTAFNKYLITNFNAFIKKTYKRQKFEMRPVKKKGLEKLFEMSLEEYLMLPINSKFTRTDYDQNSKNLERLKKDFSKDKLDISTAFLNKKLSEFFVEGFLDEKDVFNEVNGQTCSVKGEILNSLNQFLQTIDDKNYTEKIEKIAEKLRCNIFYSKVQKNNNPIIRIIKEQKKTNQIKGESTINDNQNIINDNDERNDFFEEMSLCHFQF